MVKGTQGYGEDAAAFIERTEAIPFSSKHRQVIHLVPTSPCRILDVGAGCGADAAGFAALGHSVLAVEPTPELRDAGIARHPSDRIEWGDDSLPDLVWTRARRQRFDLVVIAAVWMHLDEGERKRAMPHVASLLAAGGTLFLSLRHGLVPPAKRMFPVTAAETIALAEAQGLRCVINVEAESLQAGNRRAGVTWTHLAFERTT